MVRITQLGSPFSDPIRQILLLRVHFDGDTILHLAESPGSEPEMVQTLWWRRGEELGSQSAGFTGDCDE